MRGRQLAGVRVSHGCGYCEGAGCGLVQSWCCVDWCVAVGVSVLFCVCVCVCLCVVYSEGHPRVIKIR